MSSESQTSSISIISTGKDVPHVSVKRNSDINFPMKPMALHKYLFACVTLGLLCGWYYVIVLLYPTLAILAWRGSYIAGTILAIFLALQYMPLKHKHWDGFIYCFVFDIWKEYFNFTYDHSSVKGKLTEGERFIFFEFPHAIFPLGQILSASIIKDFTPGKMVCGTGADVIFSFPIMRHIMAWIGTRPANRKSMSKIFEDGHYCAVIPGGIAEMYVTSTDKETIILRQRKGTVKLAIQQGAHIVPVFFFGNSRIFDVAGNSGSDSWFSKFSRRIRASIIFFYGKLFLTIPYRHPIHLVSGDIVHVKKNENPSDEEIEETLGQVIKSVEKLYKEKCPEWEKRPLIIE